MSLITAERRATADVGFPLLLRTWRQKRRMSQLDLALTSGVSQRHVSFLESGRANPSRGMILQLSETLEVPLRDRNDWLTAAGFAPLFRTRPLDDPQMSQVMSAVRMMLTNHEPFPAIALDRAWNVRMSNAPFDMMIAMLGPDLWDRVGARQPNLMRLFFHPAGIRPVVKNWAKVAPLLWRRALKEAEAVGGQDVAALVAEFSAYQDPHTLAAVADTGLFPVLPVEMEIGGMTVSLFTVIATFGTAQDVTADELRIESLFPADEATEALFRNAAASRP